MMRFLMFPFGLAAVGLFTLRALARDLRLWWAWRKEDKTPRAVAQGRAALRERCAGDAAGS